MYPAAINSGQTTSSAPRFAAATTSTSARRRFPSTSKFRLSTCTAATLSILIGFIARHSECPGPASKLSTRRSDKTGMTDKSGNEKVTEKGSPRERGGHPYLSEAESESVLLTETPQA